jgi:protein-disulfide isomerase
VKLKKSVLTAIIVSIAVVTIVSIKAALFYRQSSVRPQTWELAPRAKGNPRASVKVVEFTDFQCPACAMAVNAIDEVIKKFPEKIFFEHKYYPLPMHPFAKRAAIFAECAAEQGKFWPFHDVLYRSQQSWVKMASVDEYFSQLAVSLGIDGVRLSVCINNPLILQKVDKDVTEGKKLGVNSTPSFFVNGKMSVGSANFKKEIERILGPNVK